MRATFRALYFPSDAAIATNTSPENITIKTRNADGGHPYASSANRKMVAIVKTAAPRNSNILATATRNKAELLLSISALRSQHPQLQLLPHIHHHPPYS